MFSQKILDLKPVVIVDCLVGGLVNCSAGNWKHCLCQSSLRGNKAEPGVNRLLRFANKIHTGEKFHLCQLCGKRFVTSSELKKRGLSHTGEKPHLCMTCGKGYI